MSLAVAWLLAWLILSVAYTIVGLILSSILWIMVRLAGKRWLRAAWAGALLFLVAGLITVYFSPDDFRQGGWIRCLYIHVPSALASLLAYSVLLGSTIREVTFRHPLAAHSAKTLALIGSLFMAVAMLVGAAWGRRVWGVYWLWGDGRMASSSVLLFVYLALAALAPHQSKAVRIGAVILAFVGALDLPVIYASDIWRFESGRMLGPFGLRVLHEMDVMPDLRIISDQFFLPLGLMTVAFVMLFIASYLTLMRAGIFGTRPPVSVTVLQNS